LECQPSPALSGKLSNERETELAAVLSFFQIFEIFVVLLLDSGAWFGRSGGGEICWRGSNERNYFSWGA
jgi:hypothetical protein